ncbi:hypothetical protein [Streptomyces fuscichromogenes]|uniref:Uncharacterized protein n=1 Tax=Streptomyces fuscichromogenes TaxID=1324013 RepID=A0A918CWU3_9ACTN|nr:hypothetical protein [Streptomyces fuscichromogenes]GGN40839.1 hypothetical protein GCM10011578_088500 [Streptomyces fuscichromogenes]
MLSALSPGTVFGVPVSLALAAAAVLVSILLLIGIVAWVALRRVNRADLPVVLLGLAHVISALCGLLPWGRPTPPPALPQQSAGETEPVAGSTVVLMRAEPSEPAVVRREER